MFAGVMMIMAGGFQSLAGMAALFKDDFYVTTPNYLLEFDTTSWGWIHLLIGLLVLFAGFAVLNGKVWGRTIGVILAVLSALANFAFIPYYPFWSTDHRRGGHLRHLGADRPRPRHHPMTATVVSASRERHGRTGEPHEARFHDDAPGRPRAARPFAATPALSVSPR